MFCQKHLMFIRGVKVSKKTGKAVCDTSQRSKVKTSCGINSTDHYNAIDFNNYRKEFPNEACKKCLSRFLQLMHEAKKLNENM